MNIITQRPFISELNRFIDYVNSFYNIETGIYKLFTYEDIVGGIMLYLMTTKNDVAFDSVDREFVRTLMENK